LSGDSNPLHRDDAFAHKRGFRSRVVYGLLLTSYVSKMVGKFLPGENCLLLGIDLKFVSPCYVGDTIEVAAVVDSISIAVKAAVLRIVITNKGSGEVLAKGKTTVGFTSETGKGGDA
jgi:acyl dehydratase